MKTRPVDALSAIEIGSRCTLSTSRIGSRDPATWITLGSRTTFDVLLDTLQTLVGIHVQTGWLARRRSDRNLR